MLTWIWKRLGDAALADWLWAYGGGALASVLLRAFTPLSWPWIALLGVGVVLLLIAAVLTWNAQRKTPAAPLPAQPARRERIGYRMRGGSHKGEGVTISNQDVAFDTDGTDLDHKDIKIR